MTAADIFGAAVQPGLPGSILGRPPTGGNAKARAARDRVQLAYAAALAGGTAEAWREFAETMMDVTKPKGTKRKPGVWPPPAFKVTLASGWNVTLSVAQPSPDYDAAQDAGRLARIIYRARHCYGPDRRGDIMDPAVRIGVQEMTGPEVCNRMARGHPLLPAQYTPEVATVELVRPGGVYAEHRAEVEGILRERGFMDGEAVAEEAVAA